MKKVVALVLVLINLFAFASCDFSFTRWLQNDDQASYFVGEVISIYEESCLLEVVDEDNYGYLVGGTRVIVSTDVKNCPDFEVDDYIKVFFDGTMTKSNPPQITRVFKIEKSDYVKEIDFLPEPEHNLEYWIADRIIGADFDTHIEKYGLMGGREFYGKEYIPTIDENGRQVDPKHCVIYTVTSFPDYSDWEQHVTSIEITDPKITFYGISLESSFEEFEEIIQKQGFVITGSSQRYRMASKGKYTIYISKDSININFKVENKHGIIF